ncbi:protein bric-a-brac 1 isoform X3 [Musca domestica]|uniref:Protein bric-a-brac 1 isoform X3 n=1 Tax=Musca domestica TaxID=7370 RepID=A0ABM3UPQ6_MUSDO|nr:protein bric-a-brac 1 isoform X3 [Musca domestica]
MDSKSSPTHRQQDESPAPNPTTTSSSCSSAADNVQTFRELLEAASSKAMAKQQQQPSQQQQQHSPQAPRSHSRSSSLLHSLTGSPKRSSSPGMEPKKAKIEQGDTQHHKTPPYSSDIGDSAQQRVGGNLALEASYSPHSDRSSAGSHSANGSSQQQQQFCLRWNNYQSNLTSVFDQLLQTEAFVDVTLACDGRSIKAHKMVLSACSPYFQTLFSTTPCQHPIVIMRDVNWPELKAIVDFMYKGEINVSQDQIGPLLRIAEMLKVRGLADVGHISTSSNEAPHSSTKADQTSTSDKELYSPPLHLSPKIRKKSLSPFGKRPPSRRSSDQNEPADSDMELLTPMEPEKSRSRVEASGWDLPSTSGRSGLELRLSPPMVSRNVRKRRWPSADTVFNPPESPLGSLIAAERAEQERNRERERERQRGRDSSLFTPPLPVITGSSSSVLDASAHLEFPSPSPTPAPSLLPPARTPSSLLASSASPHLQLSHHHQQQQQQQQHHHHHLHHQQQQQQQAQQHQGQQSSAAQHSSSSTSAGIGSGGGGGLQSHRSSPASSVTSTHPSSILSRPLTPSPTSVSGPGSSRLETERFSAQAAAMLGDISASAAASMGMRSLPSSGPAAMTEGGRLHGSSIADDLEIKPGIAEMIREEERAKMLENSHAWMGGSSSSIAADSYQYQLQSMWQKCWSTNQNLMHHLRFRERGPLKSWRPETMAEAIFSVLKEGLSLSQAARKYDIPYPTFVLYANRVHNMLGPSIDGGPDLRPKGRGRPQRILLGIWPDEHIKGVIKTVVFREGKDIKDEGLVPHLPYGRHSQEPSVSYPGVSAQCPNGIPTPTPTGDQMAQEATAAAVAAVAHNLRQQMQMAAAQQQQQQQQQHGPEGPGGQAGLFNLPPHLAGSGALPVPSGPGGMILPKTSISPALSSASSSGAVGSMMGPRHAPSPCGPGMPVMTQLPHSVAAALHMAGSPASRCDPNALLSQQQQHQLHQLHLQQQHAMHQQQQHKHQHSHGHQHPHQHQHSQLGAYGQHHLSLSHPGSMTGGMGGGGGTPTHTHHTTATTTASSTKSSSSTVSPLRRTSPPSVSPLTELGLEMAFKPSRAFSPSRLFSDDIADIVGAAAAAAAVAAASSTSSSTCTTTATVTTATITGSSSYSLPATSSSSMMAMDAAGQQHQSSSIASSAGISPSHSSTSMATTTAAATVVTSASSSNISSTGIKLEPITTSSE